MALTDGTMNDMVMPVAPLYGGGNGGFGNAFGGDGWWIILFILIIFCGGFGNGFGGFGGGNIGSEIYPWMNQSNQMNDGFRDAMMNDNVTEIRNGITGIATQLCNGFNGITQQMGANQMADLERSFAAQTANTAGFTALQAQLAQCCCDNRAATADLKYTVATENCADRYEAAQNTRDIIDATNRNGQLILDKLCQLELDGVKAQVDAKNDRIVELTNQLNMATLRESQTAQNAFIAQGLTNEVDALYNRLSNCPVPTTPVYGRTPIFTCGGNNGCGCSGSF